MFDRLTDMELRIFLLPAFSFHGNMDTHDHCTEKDAQRVIMSEGTESRRECGLGITQIRGTDEILKHLASPEPLKAP